MAEFKVPVLANVTEALPYPDILRTVQEFMSRNDTELAKKEKLSKQEVYLFKQLIENCLTEKGIAFAELSFPDLVEKLYMDMKEYSFLTPYVTDEMISKLGLEEIRINSWDCVYLTTKTGKIRLNERFLSPIHSQDIVKRLLQKSNMTIDQSSPFSLGHLGKAKRIAAFQNPIVDDEIGVCGVIRIVSFSELTRENLVEWKTATPTMIDFQIMCIAYGISMSVAGRTNSGKTGTLGCLLSEITKDESLRVITMEEGSREFNMVRRDEHGNVKNDVIHMITRESDDPKSNITLNKLLAACMRMSPDVMAIGEMRSDEAYIAMEASYTGHTIVTSVHAPSARKAYKRMVMLLAKGTSSFSEDKLYEYAVEAFPIIACQKKMKDETRKIFRIFEATGYENGKILGHNLYEYKVDRNEIGEDGKTITFGRFIKSHNMSEALQQRLIEAGAPQSLLDRFLKEDAI